MPSQAFFAPSEQVGFVGDALGFVAFEGLKESSTSSGGVIQLARQRRHSDLRFTIDAAFDGVIAACQSSPRPGQDGTWIMPVMRTAYTALHRRGHAHSVEAWAPNGALVGGLYGVEVDGVFSGESLFYRVPNASKLALLFLIDHLS